MNKVVNVISVFTKLNRRQNVIFQHLVQPEVQYVAICNLSYFKRLPFFFKMM